MRSRREAAFRSLPKEPCGTCGGAYTAGNGQGPHLGGEVSVAAGLAQATAFQASSAAIAGVVTLVLMVNAEPPPRCSGSLHTTEAPKTHSHSLVTGGRSLDGSANAGMAGVHRASPILPGSCVSATCVSLLLDPMCEACRFLGQPEGGHPQTCIIRTGHWDAEGWDQHHQCVTCVTSMLLAFINLSVQSQPVISAF